MATPIARYTKALDLVALAIREQRKGNHVNAATLFAAAAKHPSAPYAVSVIQATNSAARPLAAKAKPTRIKARRLRAEAEDEFEFEETDEGTQEVLDDLANEDPELDAEVDEDEDYDEDVEDDDGLDADEDDVMDIVESRNKARAFAASLQKMRKRSRR